MAAAGSQRRQRQQPDRQRLICVTRFASHRSGVWQLRGLGGFGGHGGPEPGARCTPEPGTGEELPTSSQAGVATTPGPDSSQLRRARGQAARAGLKQKNAAKEFDFPIPLNEASKIMKERKKVSAWNKVRRVISRMIAENENYRHRLKSQNLSTEIRVNTR
ncbi:uncharacterized protein C5orf47 homolog [Psammomys obesus]|uniref:uncharacterized protein C5orf47 homolog n=1 Tax=Psammomys obesus TaxID=48139 RepID=UPI002452D7C8|nr:uncharacterized protein C5orf47 homolog [Psammomys obesus]